MHESWTIKLREHIEGEGVNHLKITRLVVDAIRTYNFGLRGRRIAEIVVFRYTD